MLNLSLLIKIIAEKFGLYENSYYLCSVIKNIVYMEKRILTDNEWELIVAIRNYKNSMHNPSEQLEWYALKLFENLMYDNDEN